MDPEIGRNADTVSGNPDFVAYPKWASAAASSWP
jgi:hypothetical protein